MEMGYNFAALSTDSSGPGAVPCSGGGRGEAIRNIYYSDRQLPPGHDPGADYCEAPTAGSVAHGHETFWLSAAATSGRGEISHRDEKIHDCARRAR
jgi:hypothetical protein